MQCTYLKKDNTQCQAKAMQGSGFCFRHNPETVEQQQEASARGGQHNKVLSLNLEPVNLRTPEAVLRVIEETVNLVRSGKMPSNAANTIGFLVQHGMKVMEVVDRNIEANKTPVEKEQERVEEMSPEQQIRYYENAEQSWLELAKCARQDANWIRMIKNKSSVQG